MFTAIGWLFGREVHRVEANAARKQADGAERAAADARTEAQSQAAKAGLAEKKVAEEQAKSKAVRAAVTALTNSVAKESAGPRDVGFPDQKQTSQAAIEQVRALLDDLYGP